MAILRTYHTDSSNLSVTQFNTNTKIMRVLFRSGYLYYFYDIPKAVYEYISTGAPKGGKRFWRRMGNVYSYRQINRNYDIEDIK